MLWISVVMPSAFAGCQIVTASGVAIRNYCLTATRRSSLSARQRTALPSFSTRVSTAYHQSGNKSHLV